MVPNAKALSCRLLFCTLSLLLTLSAPQVRAFDPKPQQADGLSGREFFRPELTLNLSNVPAQERPDLLDLRRSAWDQLMKAAGSGAQAYLDPRSGTPTNIFSAIPLIPGTGVGNSVTPAGVAAALGHPINEIGSTEVAELMQRFIERHRVALNVDTSQLGEIRAVQVTPELWHIRIPQQVGGIPVRYGHLSATLSHGNIVLLGSESWGNALVKTFPFLSADQALDVGFAFLGGRSSSDRLWRRPQLEIVPTAARGDRYEHRLVWSFGFKRGSGVEAWELLVDAHDGTVLSFQDTNLYEAQPMTGGVYPLTNTEICPNLETCGTMQLAEPMPFANTGLAVPNDFANSAGIFDYSSGTVQTTLSGRYVRMTDTCGAINESSTTGPLHLGGTNGQHDCASGGASGGNTPAVRSGFYEVNKLMEVGRGWLPNNLWLTRQITSNMNIVNTCNAFYSTGDGTINFYRSGGGCRNTGEIAAVFDHEWGHALDDNDSGGALSNSSEAYADIASIYRLRSSCVGYGFFWTTDKGCGKTADGTGFNQNESQVGSYCDVNCSGVRDADWARHASNTPATALGFVCTHCNSGPGPCGRQVHCAAAPSRQAAWDFASRDLQSPPFNMTRDDAFNLASKIFFQGSGNISAWNACTCGGTSDGCGASNAYTLWLAADDDDGNVSNGTPHMTAIFDAFNRHGIACATPTPTNSGCAGAPTTAPTLTTGSSANNQIELHWTEVPGATRYRVLRSEGFAGCDFGKAVIGEPTGLTFTDSAVANDRPYYYVVQPVGASSACGGPASSCISATAVACAGSLSSDKSVYNCSDTIRINLRDNDLVGAGTQTVKVSSTVETTPETVILTETPAGSGKFTGTIGTTTRPVAADSILTVAHGSTVTIEYLDASACGSTNVTKTRTATIDCTGQACFGSLSIDRGTYTCSDQVRITVVDSDLAGLGTTTATARSSVETTPEQVTLTESPAGSGSFTGTIATTGAAPTHDGRLSGTDFGSLTAEYVDASPCGLAPATKQSSGNFDCAAPTITNVRAEGITGTTADIKWDTNEPGTSFVRYGTSVPPTTDSPTNSALVTAHSVKLTGLQECKPYFYSVGSADTFAQTAVANNGGSYFTFTAGGNVPSSFTSTDTPVPVPDVSSVSTVATINSADARQIIDVDVRFNMLHTNVGTTTIWLRHPDGTLVTLSNRRGGNDDNFTDTIFDDEATVLIGAGTPPFTGRFKPDGSLAALDGKTAQGTWKIEVRDDLAGDAGTITGFELLLTVTEPCVPRAEATKVARIGETCAAGGSGDGNKYWDDGETAALRLTLANTGEELLTGVRAKLTPLNPGVTLQRDTADFPDMPRGVVLTSPEPQLIATLPSGFHCGDPIRFTVDTQTNQGLFTNTLQVETAGQAIPSGTATKLFEEYSAGIPPTWTIEDKGSGGGAAATWTTSNPGGRTANLPIAAPFAIVDSQAAGADATQDERMTLPILDLTGALSVRLEWDAVFVDSTATDERGDVDVLSSKLNDPVTVFRYQSNSANPDHRSIDITNEAAGADDVQITFRYNRGANSRWWIVDNIRVTYVYPASCALVTCAATTRPSEVLRLHWDSHGSATWSPATNASQYTLYRGVTADLPRLTSTAVDSCSRITTSATRVSNINDTPARGTMTWWLVRASSGSQVGSPGRSSTNLRQQESSGNCP